MGKNVIIIHGSNRKDKKRQHTPEYIPQNIKSWVPWIKEKLEERGIEVHVPLMPESWEPNYEKWKGKFEKNEIDGNGIIVAASCGGGFILRWLSENDKKVKKLILIAPSFTAREGLEYLKEFYNFEIDLNFKNKFGDLTVFTSDNDKSSFINDAKFIHKKLGGKLIEIKGAKHFTEKSMGTKEFPELLDEILK